MWKTEYITITGKFMASGNMVGLADCNNFFVSCERSRDARLKGRAVVVLSNNDGCVVARSNEAKQMGVKMGQPAFQIKDIISSGALIALSGDHLLYRDISLRVHDIFRRYAPVAVDYSVDEAFLMMEGIPTEALQRIGEGIVKESLERLDIPVTVGFAPSKTLAKIVTEHCKKNGRSVGVLPPDSPLLPDLLRSTPAGDIWGIGRRLAKKLYLAGIHTAADFAACATARIRALAGVNGEKIWQELNGVDCIDLSHVDRPLQDSISESRTFPEDISDYDYIRARIAIYAADCARRLRRMNGQAGQISVFLSTNPFRPEIAGLHPVATRLFPTPLSETMAIVGAATEALDSIYRPDIPFKRAGVVLDDIRPDIRMNSIFETEEEIRQKEEKQRLMKAIDAINPKTGHSCIRLASQMTCGQKGHNDGYSSSFQAPKK